MKWPSFVRYWLVSGFGEAKCPWYGSSSTSSTLVPDTVMPIAHSPTDINETSTTTPSPVRSRLNRAAPMPPAIAMPDCRSPNPGPGIGDGNSWPGACAPIAAPDRPQYVIPSNPPRPASAPRGPWALPRPYTTRGLRAITSSGSMPQLAAGRRQQVGQEHVDVVDQRHQDVMALRRGDVQPDRPLAPVADLEQVRHALDLAGTPHAARVARRITDTRDARPSTRPRPSRRGWRRPPGRTRSSPPPEPDPHKRTWHAVPLSALPQELIMMIMEARRHCQCGRLM